MEYIILEKVEDKKTILDDIFFEISCRKQGIKRAMQKFSNREGYVVEGKAICFRNDLDEYEFSKLKIPLDEEHILLEADSNYSSIAENSQAYLTFEEFYSYLESNIERFEDTDVVALLATVKHGLNLWF